MSPVLNHRLILLAGIALGALGTVLFLQLMPQRATSPAGETGQDAAQEPLYWVAPMDPDYRRDRPGKSPMGMDLVPVYAQASGAAAG